MSKMEGRRYREGGGSHKRGRKGPEAIEGEKHERGERHCPLVSGFTVGLPLLAPGTLRLCPPPPPQLLPAEDRAPFRKGARKAPSQQLRG